jgi:hypothetical protein
MMGHLLLSLTATMPVASTSVSATSTIETHLKTTTKWMLSQPRHELAQRLIDWSSSSPNIASSSSSRLSSSSSSPSSVIWLPTKMFTSEYYNEILTSPIISLSAEVKQKASIPSSMDPLSWTIVEVELACKCLACREIGAFLLSSSQQMYKHHGSTQQYYHIIQTLDHGSIGESEAGERGRFSRFCDVVNDHNKNRKSKYGELIITKRALVLRVFFYCRFSLFTNVPYVWGVGVI